MKYFVLLALLGAFVAPQVQASYDSRMQDSNERAATYCAQGHTEYCK